MSADLKPGWVRVEAVRAEDGKLCLIVNDLRVAGCKPAPVANNIVHTWNVRIKSLQDAIAEKSDAVIQG